MTRMGSAARQARRARQIVELNEFLCPGLGTRRIAAGVCRNELDFAATERTALLLEECRNALLHLDAALGERAGLDREQANLERRRLRNGRGKAERCRYGGSSGRECAAAELTGHVKPPGRWSVPTTVMAPSARFL